MFREVWGKLAKTFFSEVIIHKIFETNSSFHVKQGTTRKIQFLFFKMFLLVATKFLFWHEAVHQAFI